MDRDIRGSRQIQSTGAPNFLDSQEIIVEWLHDAFNIRAVRSKMLASATRPFTVGLLAPLLQELLLLGQSFCFESA
jgi:hypothetical protein